MEMQEGVVSLIRRMVLIHRPQEWMETPAGYKLDALAVDDPTLQAIVLEHLPEAQTPLADTTGNTKLRYLGFTPAVAGEDDDASAIRLNLYFEVLAPFDQDYTLWFHIVNRATNQEFMLYDYTDLPGTTQWPTGEIFQSPITLTLDPGEYDVSFGFWTPETRERLYVDKAQDVYWINLPPLQP